MNNTELANFKKKLSIELETTTNDEAQLISNIVDSANAGALPAVSADDNGKVLTVSSGAWGAANIPSQLPTVTSSDEGKVLAVNSSGAWAAAQPSGGGDGKAITLHTNNIVNYTVYAKFDNEVAPLGGAEAAIFIENNLITLDLLENVYLFGTLIEDNGERNVVPSYTVLITENITSDEVPSVFHYIEGGTAVLVLRDRMDVYFIPSTDVIKEGTGEVISGN